MGFKRRTKHQTEAWRVAQAQRLRDHHEPAQRRTLKLLTTYIERHGWRTFSSSSADGTRWRGVQLGQWVTDRRREYRANTLPQWLIEALQAIPGWEWEPTRARHQRALSALRVHVARCGRLPRPGEVTIDGVDLSVWISGRRKAHRAGTVPAWLSTELEAIPTWSWQGRRRFPEAARRDPRSRRHHTRRRPARRDPATIVADASAKLDKPAAQVLTDITTLAGWIDSVRAATRSRLPPAVHRAIAAESRRRDRDEN